MTSAAEYSESVVKRLDSINQRFDEFRAEQRRLNEEQDKRNREQDRLLLAHSAWDNRTVVALRAKGVPVDDPPPLFLQ